MMVRFRHAHVVAGVAIALVIGQMSGLSVAHLEAAVPGGNGKIVFTSDRFSGSGHNNREIWAMEPDGSGLTRLTFNGREDNVPDWSPDGTQIAYMSSLSGNLDIWVMNVDGASPHNITNDPRNEHSPSWSPDGTKIAFDGWTSHVGSNLEVWTVNVDGSGRENLTAHLARDEQPAWSPDGRRLAFASDRAGSSDIWVMDMVSKEVEQLTTDSAWENYPDWSPDGMQLAFTSNRDGNNEIYLMNADGTNIRNLTNHPADDSYPSWSPDGTKIAFQSRRVDNTGTNGKSDIYVMNAADGSGISNLTVNTAGYSDFAPSWQSLNRPPDCKHTAAQPSELWPLNNQLVDVVISGYTDPDGDILTPTVTGITQDEPVGKKAPDGQIVAGPQVQLRAERDGKGDGRVYAIAFTIVDDGGLMCSGVVSVTVPHDQAGEAVDSGQVYDATTTSLSVRAGSAGDEEHRVLLPLVPRD